MYSVKLQLQFNYNSMLVKKLTAIKYYKFELIKPSTQQKKISVFPAISLIYCRLYSLLIFSPVVNHWSLIKDSSHAECKYWFISVYCRWPNADMRRQWMWWKFRIIFRSFSFPQFQHNHFPSIVFADHFHHLLAIMC